MDSGEIFWFDGTWGKAKSVNYIRKGHAGEILDHLYECSYRLT